MTFGQRLKVFVSLLNIAEIWTLSSYQDKMLHHVILSKEMTRTGVGILRYLTRVEETVCHKTAVRQHS